MPRNRDATRRWSKAPFLGALSRLWSRSSAKKRGQAGRDSSRYSQHTMFSWKSHTNKVPGKRVAHLTTFLRGAKSYMFWSLQCDMRIFEVFRTTTQCQHNGKPANTKSTQRSLLQWKRMWWLIMQCLAYPLSDLAEPLAADMYNAWPLAAKNGMDTQRTSLKGFS